MIPRASIGLWLLMPFVMPAGVRADSPEADGARFFDASVKPILEANCLSCHGGGQKIKGGLRLTSREEVLRGGDGGSVVSLDQPESSRLLQAVRYQELKMPPKGKLPEVQIDVLARWVHMKVPWSATSGRLTAKHAGSPAVDAQAKQFWSFRPVTRPPVPMVKHAPWLTNPIDAFVMAKLEAAGLQPAPPADKGMLLRRVYYDVLGLPPTPEQIGRFIADSAADAYERVVDELLASPHYGEHWARHWLDLVRYAETNSFERDGAKPNAWRYRDYVISSFNANKPYDQFIREQLAGDELEAVTPELMIATGYYRLGQWDDEPVDREQAYYDGLDDIISTTGQVFLGLTVGCARCHDHKIDPFPQKDYYRLLGFFHGVTHYAPGAATQRAVAVAGDWGKPAERARMEAAVAAHEKKVADLTRQLTEIEDKLLPFLQGGERDDFKYEANRLYIVQNHRKELGDELKDKYDKVHQMRLALERKKPAGPRDALCVTENKPRDTYVLQRGNPQARGEKVEPGFPSVLPEVRPVAFVPSADGKTSGRRRALSDWIASKDNPLTARVIVNRIWQYHFGRGLVRSSNNYGYQGTPPTHPELLDWLASEFTAGGWDIKALHRLILLSSVYRMASNTASRERERPEYATVDPENDLYWRFDPRRLSAEEIRDSILCVSGNLHRHEVGGPSIFPVIPPEVHAGQSKPGDGWRTSPAPERNRRSVYVHVKRSLALPILTAFDAADTDASCPVRFTTTQPTQALGMLNSVFLNEQAQVFADGVRRDAGPAPAAQVALALERTLQRRATAAEIERGVQFIERMIRDEHQEPGEVLRSFCLLALNLTGFVYVD